MFYTSAAYFKFNEATSDESITNLSSDRPSVSPCLGRVRPASFFSARWQFADASQAVFMQGETPPHTARNTRQWCLENPPGFRGRGVRPGNSLDLNPVETLWLIFKDKVNKATSATTADELMERLERMWYNIQPSVPENLGTRMSQRIHDSITKDDHTGK